MASAGNDRFNAEAAAWDSNPDVRAASASALQALLAAGVGPVHFCGEHTANMWATAIDGAMRSGERAADEVLQRRESLR